MYVISPPSLYKWLKKMLSVQKCPFWIADQTGLDWRGGYSVWKWFCLRLSCFYAVEKANGDISILLNIQNTVGLKVKKSVWRPSWTHKSLLVKRSDDLSYVEQSELYSRATWSLECMGSVWPVCWHALSGGLKAEMQHLGTDVKKAERFCGGGKTWSPLTVSEFIFQLLI